MEQLLWDENLRPRVLEQVMKATKEEWLNKAKIFYQYHKQHPYCSADNRKKLLGVIKCGELADMDLIKYWQGGLSKQYREYVRNTCSRLHRGGGDLTDKA